MKILFISHNFYPFVGGIEVSSEFLARAYVSRGHLVKLVTWTKDPEYTDFPFEVFRSPGIARLVRLHQWADLVFENNPSLRLSWPALLSSKPVVVAVHTWLCRENGGVGLRDHIKMYYLKNNVKKVIAVSKAIQKQCGEKAIVIGNSYRAGSFRRLPEIARERDFVFLGRLVSDKGADKAIRAIHYLKRLYNKRYTLTIIGEGPEKDYLHTVVRRFGLQEQVKFTGMLRGPSLEKHMNMHRFLLVPSVWEEPFGVVVLEGLACGCIPIVSDGGGLPEAVGEAGLTFERGSFHDLIRTIQKLLNDPDLASNLASKALPQLAAHHPDIIARHYIEEIESVAMVP